MKIFLSDLDGTLMDHAGNISADDVRAIKQWLKSYKFGLVTGRDQSYCSALMERYGLEADYLIVNNGANVYLKDECIFSNLIDLDKTIDICHELIKINKGDIFFTDEKGNSYYPIKSFGKDRYASFMHKQPELGGFSDIDIIEYLNERKNGCAKISIYVDEDIDELLAIYQKMFHDVEIMKTSVDYIEFTAKNVNKGIAFDHLELDLDDVIFIGDGANDIALMQKLKHNYVMSSADEIVKKYGYIVDSVSEAIEKELSNV